MRDINSGRYVWRAHMRETRVALLHTVPEPKRDIPKGIEPLTTRTAGGPPRGMLQSIVHESFRTQYYMHREYVRTLI